MQASWICCQIGAREHYAVPRALISQQVDVQLLTDVWASSRNSWCLPKRWRQRKHSEISTRQVCSWNVAAIGLHTLSRIHRQTLWERIFLEDRWFQKKVAKQLADLVAKHPKPPIVFAYSYAAKEIFKTAKALGCHTVLGQIDPGPVEMRLVQQLERQHGCTSSDWPPQQYWDDWAVECKLADAIVVNSEWSRTALLSEGIPENRIHTIPLAYEQRIATDGGDRPVPVIFDQNRPLKILFLGQVILRKGIKELCEAIRLLEDAPIEWTIVGGGTAGLLDELSSLPQTTVTGAVTRTEVEQHYQDCDVFILPTHSDGFAITQLEAASFGLPIIASRFCGDVVMHETNGLLLNSVTGSCIASTVERLLATPEIVAKMTLAQKQRPNLGMHGLAQHLLRLESYL